jgi:hypothetical protein
VVVDPPGKDRRFQQQRQPWEIYSKDFVVHTNFARWRVDRADQLLFAQTNSFFAGKTAPDHTFRVAHHPLGTENANGSRSSRFRDEGA